MKFKHNAATSAVYVGDKTSQTMLHIGVGTIQLVCCALRVCLFSLRLLVLSPRSYGFRRRNSCFWTLPQISTFLKPMFASKICRKASRSAVINVLEMRSIMGSGSLIPAACVLTLRIQATCVLLSDSTVNSTLEDWHRGRRDVLFCSKLGTLMQIWIKSALILPFVPTEAQHIAARQWCVRCDPPTASTHPHCACLLREWWSSATVINICIWIVPPAWLNAKQQDKCFGTAISFLLHNKHPYLLMFPFYETQGSNIGRHFHFAMSGNIPSIVPSQTCVFHLIFFVVVVRLSCHFVFLLFPVFSSTGLLVFCKPQLDRGQRPSVRLTLNIDPEKC